MSNVKKLMMTAAGGGGLNVEDVFSTYLYTGTNTTNTINNGIDLDGESGIIWIKNRDQSDNHYIFGGESGNDWTKILTPNANGYYGGATSVFDGVSSTGFTVKSDFDGVNRSGEDYVSWTFRKAPKFFDVVTYTGNGTAGREIAHNLGTTVGAIIIKRTDTSSDWAVFHRAAGENLYYKLNTADGYQVSGTIWDATLPTSTVFTVGSDAIVNASGGTYVAYLFAHNNGDGDFGDGTQDIIKCGSYGGNSSTTGPVINLGFEPQWLLVRRASVTGEFWQIVDNMRGATTGGNDSILYPNANNAELSTEVVEFNATGFQPKTTSASWNASGNSYFYIAIRRGPMAVPESADEVFAIDTRTAVSSVSGTDPSFSASFPADMALWRTVDTAANNLIASRLTQSKLLYTNLTNAEATSTNGVYYFDKENGWFSTTSSDPDSYSWMWGRAPNFFDVVCYRGNGTSGHTINHNLGVAPEMMWIKNREATNNVYWTVYHKDVTGYAHLNSSSAWISTVLFDSIGSTSFDLLYSSSLTNTNQNYIAYLFASLDGVSKVGSYTGTGSDLTIDCGFSSGARFVLIKCTSSTGNWFLFDTERGITASDSPRLTLDTSDAQSSANLIDPDNSGFIARSSYGLVNTLNQEYIFYAIA